MTAGSLYTFQTTWRVQAEHDEVFEILRDYPDYPRWWPQVKSVKAPGEGGAGDRYATECRSILPYTLRFDAEMEVIDKDAGLLRVHFSGDLNGFSAFQLSEGTASGLDLHYRQEVTLAKSLLNAMAPVVRPLFQANHSHMMRSGEKGLRELLKSR